MPLQKLIAPSFVVCLLILSNSAAAEPIAGLFSGSDTTLMLGLALAFFVGTLWYLIRIGVNPLLAVIAGIGAGVVGLLVGEAIILLTSNDLQPPQLPIVAESALQVAQQISR